MANDKTIGSKANHVNDDFRSRRNKRRRITGYDNRVVRKRHKKKQKLGVGGESSSLALEKDQKNVPCRIRRRVELKKNPIAGYCTSGDGTKRLRTHVWHAKRFRMTKLSPPFGFFGQLHHVGGPFSQTIAPVMYVWRPSFQCGMSMDINNCKLDGSNEPWRIKILLFISPTLGVATCIQFFNEGYDMLKFACQMQMDETGIQINCFSLEGQLAKFEVMRLKAYQLLQRILHAIT